MVQVIIILFLEEDTETGEVTLVSDRAQLVLLDSQLPFH